MANTIKDLFGTPTAFTITLASLADSAVGVGQQATLVSNASPGFSAVMVVVQIKQGTSPVANGAVYVYGIRGDGTGVNDDGAGASDAAFTAKNVDQLGVLPNGSAPATGDVLTKSFLFLRPGPLFGVAIVNNTGVALDATPGNHVVKYYEVDPQVQ